MKKKIQKPLAQLYANGFIVSLPTPYLYIKGEIRFSSLCFTRIPKSLNDIIHHRRIYLPNPIHRYLQILRPVIQKKYGLPQLRNDRILICQFLLIIDKTVFTMEIHIPHRPNDHQNCHQDQYAKQKPLHSIPIQSGYEVRKSSLPRLAAHQYNNIWPYGHQTLRRKLLESWRTSR